MLFRVWKLGAIGFGGIAGMVATIEDEMVVRRKWIDHQHFMDVLSTSYIIPGPNAVEVVMHCGYERGGRLGLVVAGICYILPAMLICLLFGYFYQRYSSLPDVQQFIFGLRPATTALVIGTVFRLSSTTLKNNLTLTVLCILVFVASFLPSFFISFFLHLLLSSARKNQRLRIFLDALSAASISIIAVVGFHLLSASLQDLKAAFIPAVCLILTLSFRKLSTVFIILIGSVSGFASRSIAGRFLFAIQQPLNLLLCSTVNLRLTQR